MGKTVPKIEWTDSSINFVFGCTKVSAGCQNCYMFTILNRFKKYDPNEITYLNMDNIRKNIKNYGQKIFVNSMSDTFHENIPFQKIDEWFALMREFPNKQFQIVTKRPNRMREYFETRECPSNVWLGTTVEDQAHVFRIDTLRRTRTNGIRFLSCEPLVGRINEADLTNINWVIVGGENDFNNPRIMQKDWAEHLCFNIVKKQNVKLFFKQWGGRGGDGIGGNRIRGQTITEFPQYQGEQTILC